MKSHIVPSIYQLAIATIFTISEIFISTNLKTLAQLIPDHTLGQENSIINNINANKDLVNGGATRGANLFHSFQEFNVDENKSVYFANPMGIENILTRVTGSNVSNILGTIGVEGIANLFLINPNGIIFGGNSNLDIRGSFTATTADSITLGKDGLFSATNPLSSNLLTITPGALFPNALKNEQAEIRNAGNLKVDNNKNITLFSSNFSNTGRLTAIEGKIQLTGIENLIIRGEIETNTLLLNTKNLTIGEDNNSTIDKTTLEHLSGNTNLIFQSQQDISIHQFSSNSLEFVNGNGSITFIADTDNNGIGNFQMNSADTIHTNGRNIEVQAVDLHIGNINTSSELNGGNITLITTQGDISTQDLNSSSLSFGGNAGNGGVINLSSNQGDISTQNLDSSSLSFGGNAGNGGVISFSTNQGEISTQNLDSSSLSFTGNAGNGGVINFSTNQGDISTQDLNSFSLSFGGNAGNGGAINLSTIQGNMIAKSLNSFSLSESESKNAGNGGEISLVVGRDIRGVENEFLKILTLSSSSQSGDVMVRSFADLSLTNINIITGKQVTIDSLPGRIIDVSGIGQSGNVNIISDGNITLYNSLIESDTRGSDPAGNVNITSLGTITLRNSQITSNTSNEGNAGNIQLNAQNLIIPDTSNISASTTASGNGGDLILTVPKNISIFGQGLLVVESKGSGDAGNILISTQNLNITDGVKISASTSGEGKGGNINVYVDRLTANNGAQFLTTTSSDLFKEAQAGNINLQVRDNITLDGTETGIFANTEKDSKSDSGSINIDSKTVIIKNGAGIGVNSLGAGNGGNIDIQADTISLDNQVFITAETASNQGGEINLNIEDLLLLRNNSRITATAGKDSAGGNGGDININSPLIVAFPNENSDITANAFAGKGGNIIITTNAIFGLEFTRQETPRSDITASSQFGVDGDVEINTPNVDLSYGLIELPSSLVDAASQLSQGCRNNTKIARQENLFTIVGQGGLPSNPSDLLTGTTPLVNLVNLVNLVDSQEIIKSKIIPDVINNESINRKNPVIQEAQGWIITGDGQVFLTAETPRMIIQKVGLNHPVCQVNHQGKLLKLQK